MCEREVRFFFLNSCVCCGEGLSENCILCVCLYISSTSNWQCIEPGDGTDQKRSLRTPHLLLETHTHTQKLELKNFILQGL